MVKQRFAAGLASRFLFPYHFAGIIRIRFNGYNLSLRRHPF